MSKNDGVSGSDCGSVSILAESAPPDQEHTATMRSPLPSVSNQGGFADISSSSSGEEEGTASPPPNKRRKVSKPPSISDPRVDNLISQVGQMTEYLTRLPLLLQQQQSQAVNTPSTSQSAYLKNPNTQPSHCLSLGKLEIDLDEKSILPQADKGRLEEICNLQQFNSPAWQGIRYKRALQSFLATPGFMGLKVNNEMCHFNSKKDYLASTEELLAGLSNAVLEHRQLLQCGLQSLIDWASANPDNVNANTLFEKISSTFGPGTSIYKNSETTMQVICGKRAECIEGRRDRILKEISNHNLKATLRQIPPSAENLFHREALLPVIQSLGGSSVWLNTPAYLKEKRPAASTSHQTHPTRASTSAHAHVYRGSNNHNNNSRINKNKNSQRKFKREFKTNSSFRSKDKK